MFSLFAMSMPITGGSLNPAITLINDFFIEKHNYVFIIFGQVIGGIIASVIFVATKPEDLQMQLFR